MVLHACKGTNWSFRLENPSNRHGAATISVRLGERMGMVYGRTQISFPWEVAMVAQWSHGSCKLCVF